MTGTTTRVTHSSNDPNRSTAMLLLSEDLARAQLRERHQQAQSDRRVYALVAARRWERRAARARQRAHRALAML